MHGNCKNSWAELKGKGAETETNIVYWTLKIKSSFVNWFCC